MLPSGRLDLTPAFFNGPWFSAQLMQPSLPGLHLHPYAPARWRRHPRTSIDIITVSGNMPSLPTL